MLLLSGIMLQGTHQDIR